MQDQLFNTKNKTYSISYDNAGCSNIELWNPKVDNYNGMLRVKVDAKAQLGQQLGDQCLTFLNWQGKLDLYNTIKLSQTGRSIIIKTVDSKLLTSNGKVDTNTNQLWQMVQNNVYPLMDKVVIDLNKPLNDLKTFMPGFLGNKEQIIADQLINSFAINNINSNPDAVLLNLKFDVPDSTYVKKSAAVLSKKEIELLEKKLNALDNFVSFTIQSFLSPNTPATLRMQLLDQLIDLRYEITALLENINAATKDPVKQLFLDTWINMAPIVRDISKHYDSQTNSLGYVTFIAANDVLYTIEQIGPGFGLDVSIDGLRRLARMLNSDPSFDPLELNEDQIPTFKFDNNVVSEEYLPPVSKPQSNWLDFIIQPSYASQALSKKEIKRLNNWVPKRKDMNKYLPMVQQVLSQAMEIELKKSTLNKKYHKLYRSLVYATAWQESCWRQFQVVKRQRWPLKSSSGDLGLMQINPRVWRGFYSVHKIKWDITYNARTGAEIIMHYLQRYAIRKKEHIKTGKLDNLARATYSGYNGGPRQYARYRNKNAPKQIKRIDKAFYKKFTAVYNGNTMAVKSCYPGI